MQLKKRVQQLESENTIDAPLPPLLIGILYDMKPPPLTPDKQREMASISLFWLWDQQAGEYVREIQF